MFRESLGLGFRESLGLGCRIVGFRFKGKFRVMV